MQRLFYMKNDREKFFYRVVKAVEDFKVIAKENEREDDCDLSDRA